MILEEPGISMPIEVEHATGEGGVFLVGTPNVGKSSLFNLLGDAYVVVSNYPGTTVGVTHASLYLGEGKGKIPISDPPGLYSLIPMTEEERVARDALFASHASCVVHVLDAKNLDRQLPLTLQLREAGLPLVLALNMWDEAQHMGLEIDTGKLSQRLGVPVVLCSARTKEGIEELKKTIEQVHSYGTPPPFSLPWSTEISDLRTQVAVEVSKARASEELHLPARLTTDEAARFVLEGDEVFREACGIPAGFVDTLREDYRTREGHRLSFDTACFLRDQTDEFLADAWTHPDEKRHGFGEKLSRVLINPWSGIPILMVVLYLGFYQFVGVLGAGTVVGWIENDFFGAIVNPWLNGLFETYVGSEAIRELFVGDYGVLTLGITYAIGLVLPIVFFFFLVFSLVEDSGYFPRFAMLVDRVFKKMGLNGRAVIPMVLGFGCDTMATITTRTLETKRERILATLLLALAIPCSAQLAIIMAILGSFGIGVWLSYMGILMGVLLLVGWLGSKLLPGEAATFYMELPPLRMPRASNVLMKSFARMRWYFKEVLPLFLIASVVLWGLDQTGGIGMLERGMEPILAFIGLPVQTSESFVIGFFRRDFGAAGLFKLHLEGMATGNPVLTAQQVFTAAVTLTLFVPCIAQFMVMLKERGPKVALGTTLFVTGFAVATGAIVHRVLLFTGWLA